MPSRFQLKDYVKYVGHIPEIPPDKICDGLEAFLLDNGGSINGVRCMYTEEGGGRGLVASVRIKYQFIPPENDS